MRIEQIMNMWPVRWGIIVHPENAYKTISPFYDVTFSTFDKYDE